MEPWERLVQQRLLAEVAEAPPLERIRGEVMDTVIERRAPGDARRAWPVVAAVVSVLVIVGGGGALLNTLASHDRATREPSRTASSAQPMAQPLGSAALEAATETLLAASRRGAVPTISSVWNRKDRSGLVVGVPGTIVERYGKQTLIDKFAEVADVPISVEVKELAVPG